MNDQQALDMLKQILDQCAGNGMFKTLETAAKIHELQLYIQGRLHSFPQNRNTAPIGHQGIVADNGVAAG